MIKGIYNENEFYTNFYWDTKLLEDMRSKAPAGFEEKINQLKALDGVFWRLKESVGSYGANQGQQIEFYNLLFRILGFQPVQEPTQTTEGAHYTRFLNENKDSNPELVGILTSEIETGSFEATPLYLTDKIEDEENAFELDLKELLREELLDSQAPPRWVLVGSPNSLFIIERTKWALGRYIRIEWQEVFLQRDSKPYELLLGLCSKSALCPDSGSSSHDEFDDNSHRHAFEVTTELRESVREAIEALINELIDLRKESHQKIYAKESSDIYAKELTHDALYYVYRLLFLLYLEAQGEDSELLPLKSEIYRNGYSLEKLLELDFVEVAPDSSEAKGTFIFESLEQIFNLIFYGFEPGVKDGLLKSDLSATGFLVKGIKSDLFDPNAMKHLKGVKLSNGVLLDILKKLSLTRKKERGNKPRARVSYANLGINQLGAVYEGLLSYTGFFAQEDLHALKPKSVKQSDIDKGKELDQVYLAPKSLVEKYRRTREENRKLTDENTVFEIDGNPKIYKRGSFIYRLAGRDRQKLASYYTPESLSKCTVKYSMKVLFEKRSKLDDLWSVKILEPAMGSGAFLNEAVNQLADKILELEVHNGVGHLDSPRTKKKRLWDIRYQLISNNVYGVDLNPTAVELARFSLWLNCIGAGKTPPQFEGKLKVGNSLTGARFKQNADGVFPWLLVDDGMMNYGKRLKDYDVEQFERIQSFRKEFIASKLESSHEKVRALQLQAQALLNELVISKDKCTRDTAYERLKLCGDLWCSAFYLTSEDLHTYPASHEALCATYASILKGNPINEALKKLVEKKYNNERFFVWEIEYPDVASSGGFDLILGNPPWLAVEWKPATFIDSTNPLPAILEYNSADTDEFIKSIFSAEEKNNVANEYIRALGYSNLLGTDIYQSISSGSKNTYKAFAVLAGYVCSENPTIGFIYEDGILDELELASFRAIYYKQLKFHFQFANEKKLFSEVDNKKRFSINVLGAKTKNTCFYHMSNLYLPATIDSSFDHKSIDRTPRPKNEHGEFETSGHPNRIVVITDKELELFAKYLSQDPDSTVLLKLHCKELLSVVGKLADVKETLKDYLGAGNYICSEMINEVGGQTRGWIRQNPGTRKRVDELVYSGPNIGVSNPLAKQARSQYRINSDYDEIDIGSCEDNFLPRTVYSLEVSPTALDETFPSLGNKPYRFWPRLATRGMMKAGNERSVFMTMLPIACFHINGINSIAISDNYKSLVACGIGSSLIFDAIQRLKGRDNFATDEFESMPISGNSNFHASIARRAAALNCVTKYHEPIWNKLEKLSSDQDKLLTGESLVGYQLAWRPEFSLRSALQRRQAQVEIDALAALCFNLTLEELFLIYEILFPVLNKYDRSEQYDRLNAFRTAYCHFESRGW